MDEISLVHILEAILMSADRPLTLDMLCKAFDETEDPGTEAIREALLQLTEEYSSRAIRLNKLASGYVFQTQTCFSPWIARLHTAKPAKYSRALLETLAIIAWRQPVTRADIEAIRGVTSSSNHFKTLLEREWIRVAGHRDVPGKPAVYVTTHAFLDYFNLKSLHDLPAPESAETIIS